MSTAEYDKIMDRSILSGTCEISEEEAKVVYLHLVETDSCSVGSFSTFLENIESGRMKIAGMAVCIA